MKPYTLHPRTYQLAVMTLAASAIMGCAKPADQMADSTPGMTLKDSAANAMVAKSMMSDSTGMGAQTAMSASDQMNTRMSDSSLAAFIMTTDRGEVVAGQLAIAMAKHADVKAYGQSMIAAHRSDLAAVQRLAVRGGGTMPSGASRNDPMAKLVEMHTAVMAQLNTATGDTFDRVYIDAMARGHQFVLTTITSATMYGSASPIMAHAKTLIPVVDEHQQRAMTLQGQLASRIKP